MHVGATVTPGRPERLPLSSKIRFSIVITCRNQKDFIRDAVESALAQTVASAEIIVVDDCSSDGSADVLTQYVDAIKLELLTENLGALKARNHGAAIATGEYIAFLDGDDALRPWALEVYERLIAERRPKVILGAKLWCHDVLTIADDKGQPQAIEFVECETLTIEGSVSRYGGQYVRDRA